VHKLYPVANCRTYLFQPKPGVDTGPIHLVEAGLPAQLSKLGWKVQFDGHHQFEDIRLADDPPIGILKNPRFVSRVCESVSKSVYAHINEGRLPLTLGGDHSLGMATISGTLQRVSLVMHSVF
jgi:arginase